MNNQITKEQLQEVKVVNTIHQLKIDTINLIKSRLIDNSINNNYISLSTNDIMLSDKVIDINIYEDMLYIINDEHSTAIRIDKINKIYYNDSSGDSIYLAILTNIN